MPLAVPFSMTFVMLVVIVMALAAVVFVAAIRILVFVFASTLIVVVATDPDEVDRLVAGAVPGEACLRCFICIRVM